MLKSFMGVFLQGSDNTRQSVDTSKLDLEDVVQLASRIGQEYARAKQIADRLELLKPTIRAKIGLRHDSDEITEAKLKRLTENDPEYVEFLEELATAKGSSEKLRIRYESYKNLFEAKRSMLSYKKAEMNIL